MDINDLLDVQEGSPVSLQVARGVVSFRHLCTFLPSMVLGIPANVHAIMMGRDAQGMSVEVHLIPSEDGGIQTEVYRTYFH